MSDDLIKRSDAIEVAYQLRHKPNDDEWGWWLRSFNAIPPADNEVVGKLKTAIESEELCKNCPTAERISSENLLGAMALGFSYGTNADRPQEWIPCSERMPKIGEVVLVTWEWKCKKYITTAYRVTIRGVTYWDSKLQHEYKPLNVLAWMPLPKPWKGADDED